LKNSRETLFYRDRMPTLFTAGILIPVDLLQSFLEIAFSSAVHFRLVPVDTEVFGDIVLIQAILNQWRQGPHKQQEIEGTYEYACTLLYTHTFLYHKRLS